MFNNAKIQKSPKIPKYFRTNMKIKSKNILNFSKRIEKLKYKYIQNLKNKYYLLPI